jgi:Flp pilus assembly protein TadG
MRRIERSPQRFRRDQRGTALLEFAIVLSLLLFFAIVVFEGAALIRTHQVINNAAREGARFAAQKSFANSGPGDLQQVVVNYAALNNVNITPAEVAVDQGQAIPGPNGVFISASRVTVTHPYPLVVLPNIPGFTIPTSVTLVGRAEFRNFF